MKRSITGIIMIFAILIVVPSQAYAATPKETVEDGVNNVLKTLGDPAFKAKPKDEQINIVGEEIMGAIVGDDQMKVDPWDVVIAVAENAKDNGVKIMLNTEVQSISSCNGLFVIETSQGTIKSEFIVNAAGKYADKVADMAGARDDWSLKFIHGTRLVMDKRIANLINGRVGPAPVPGQVMAALRNP